MINLHIPRLLYGKGLLHEDVLPQYIAAAMSNATASYFDHIRL